ncbi:pyrroloquinoline quinone biosynthesis protein PqqE [Methylacidiphilum caldifontis]|uniref:PqqA peptide cyclase n=1 Tax=Methylacidiphilum caldifontis TaxID=2795386 RepID=A0A4Y8PAG5_9BACT|nr:pyrroloquinoline quinone biosynthesis protein PqqE [Methylacidiphilum caldifontis]TFE67888.1 pyrroloquinoline quinone biosynthesis protein PqqE [Methylacidiphilum caldifontis]
MSRSRFLPFSLLCELTFHCPLQCPYCSNSTHYSGWIKNELSTEQWIRVLREAQKLGILQVYFSGGEPLVRKDITTLIRTAHDLGFYSNMSTGGTLIHKELLKEIKEAGLDSIQLSIQDSRPDLADQISGVKKSFEKKIEAARLILECEIPLGINVVIHRHNIDRIAEIIDFAASLGAHRLELANTQYYGWALLNRKKLLPSKQQIEKASQEASKAKEKYKGKMEILFVIPDYYSPFPKPCMQGWGKIYMTVSADGTVLPCQSARDIRSLSFPNIRSDSLENIWWNSEAFNKFRGTDFLPEPCKSCPRKEIDFGGCRCQAFLLTSDAAATDPACIYSPHHHIIERIIQEENPAETPSEDKKFIYRNLKNSKTLQA